MTTENQNSANSAETASFPAENLHVSEKKLTFAPRPAKTEEEMQLRDEGDRKFDYYEFDY